MHHASDTCDVIYLRIFTHAHTVSFLENLFLGNQHYFLILKKNKPIQTKIVHTARTQAPRLKLHQFFQNRKQAFFDVML